ncbi:MAG: tetratricopeptide repeat protein [Opitutus sp.]|nr:tetratricopeptide repeat protein [Opitutus sp.]
MRRIPPFFWVLALLLATAFAAYRHVGAGGFVNLDDDAYVEFAPMVNKGVRGAALVWAATAVHTSNWHPLTTFSHMLDCTLFGVRPAPMHWENLAWHLLNSALVLLIWHRLSGALWRSALVAALFALHPLHVESVAWISSRKDLLCTFFWLLGIAAYLRWVRRPSIGRYTVVALCLSVSLLFKPMAVTFPATLMLLDGWPLRRWPAATWFGLFREKLPLFAVVALHSVVTFVVQHGAGSADYAARIPLDARLGNAVVAYARYVGKTFWPESLSPLYWHPGYWPLWSVLGALFLLSVACTFVWRQRTARPWLAFGWLWFLGTLVPVIGIVQVGAQAMADRYTYVPLLGLFTIIAWGGAELAAALPRLRVPLGFATVAALGGCFVVTQRQVRAWENSLQLYERSIAAGEDNPAIRYLLAMASGSAGRPENEVIGQLQRAIKFQPDYINAHTQLALIALRHARFDEALAILEQNARYEPRNASLQINLGSFWSIRGDVERGIRHYQEALHLDPTSAGVHRELAQGYLKLNQVNDALFHYQAAIRSDRWNAMDWANAGFILGNMGRLAESRVHFERALWIDPDNDFSRRNLVAIVQLEQAKRN